ncbi:alpha/beta hydrolase fold domain-containing protein [Saccharothrix sp. NPDC042600]|uniref:alpha/beta hydrolase fold domain-containing protein n=1 Tax=Saccharothrix TaxID=2071 RepID=UPI0033CDBF8A|nr:alpha/beta hydrolase [Saccharothrix mutabilis subsp. capreolus]
MTTERPPWGIRVLAALGGQPDWLGLTAEELAAIREAENRKRASRLARVVTGCPERGVDIAWREVVPADRAVPVRVHRPANGKDLPLVLHVHGGGFVGTAAQSDWVNSHLAARLPAVVVSVEHRLLDHATALPAAADDGWDVLRHVVEHAEDWGIDPDRTAVFGESFGGLIAALAALRARDAGLELRAQVLVNPALDVSETGFDHPSFARHGDSPTLSTAQMRLLRRLAVPPGVDPVPLSPLRSADLGDLAPALVVVPTIDPVADHGRRYVDRLRAAGTPALLTEHFGATHAFLSMPGVVPQAKAARAEIVEFLGECLGAPLAARGR